MLHLTKGTLRYHKNRPLFLYRDVSTNDVPAVVASLNTYMGVSKEASVEEEALKFYMLNHAFALLMQQYDMDEILPDSANEIAEAYVQESQKIVVRMTYYTLLVTTRESRHLHYTGDFKTTLVTKFGPDYVKFRDDIDGLGSTGSAQYLRDHPPKIPIGKYTQAMTYVFNHGHFSGGYGGKPWGNIASTLEKLVHGLITPEMFVDTAWTLAHNNGPMFNKGMLYKHYDHDLIKILDVQRSGQIPQLINQYGGSVSGVTQGLVNLYNKCRQVLKEDFDGHVDWFAVEAAGSKGHYTAEKNAQSKAKTVKPVKAKPVSSDVSVDPSNLFYITQNEAVQIVKRVKKLKEPV
jgi:hypothetical protein